MVLHSEEDQHRHQQKYLADQELERQEEEEDGEDDEDDVEFNEEGNENQGPPEDETAPIGDALDAARKYQDLATRRQRIAQRALTRARKESKAAAADKRAADEYVAKLEWKARGEDEMSATLLDANGMASPAAGADATNDPNAKRTRMRFDVKFKRNVILEYEELKQMHANMGKQYQQKTYCEEKMGGFNQGMLSRWLKARDQIVEAANASADGPMKSIHKKDISGRKKRKRHGKIAKTTKIAKSEV